MKKLLLTTSILLLAAACNNNQQAQVQPVVQNQPAQTAQQVPTSTAAEAQTQPQATSSDESTANWQTYTNNQYGFVIQFPPYWEGYTTDTHTFTDGPISIGFNLPYTFNGQKTYYQDALQIIVYSTNAWPNEYETDGTKPPKLAENNNFVYSYEIGGDLGGNKDLDSARTDMQQILSTFKLTK